MSHDDIAKHWNYAYRIMEILLYIILYIYIQIYIYIHKSFIKYHACECV